MPRLAQLNGHWRCITSDGVKAERSYLAMSPHTKLMGTPKSSFVVGREDAIAPNRDPVGLTERLDLQPDGSVAAQTFEGDSSGTIDTDGALELRSSGAGTAPFTVTYTVAGDTLKGSVTRGTTTSTERCEREAQVPVPTTCTTPHVAPHTIQAGPLPYPAEAYQQHLSGTVAVAVTLDDRSQILWAAVQSSPSPLLNDSALSAAENTVFQVQISKCRPIAGDYIFTVEFTRR